MLERLTDDDIKAVLKNAVERVSKAGLDAAETPELPSASQEPTEPPPPDQNAPFPSFPQLTSKIMSSIVSLSTGDARTAISLLDLVLKGPKDIRESTLLDSLKRSVSASYDRTGESHYDMISALHKSVRGSQGSAAMYWLARMLQGGEDPLYIARRMVVCASEDIGLADRHALPLVRQSVYTYGTMQPTVRCQGHGCLSSVPDDWNARMPHQSCTSGSIPLGSTQVDACIRRIQPR